LFRHVLKVDLHTHTADDPHDRIPHSTVDLIDRASALGYDALAITLHDMQLDLAPYAAYALQRGVVLIPGMERTIAGRHVLLLNFSRDAERVYSFEDLACLRRREPGLVVAPHPFFPVHGLGSLLDRDPALFDAVEYNAMYTTTLNFNQAGEQWARAHDKPLVGNGDVHRLDQLGTTYSLVDADPDPASICAAIAAGDVELVTTPLSWPTAIRLFTTIVGSSLLPKPKPSAPEPARATV
jgi:predicted metal-dependent phosphoesterase TrpH